MHLICIGRYFLFRDRISITVERICRGGGGGGGLLRIGVVVIKRIGFEGMYTFSVSN